MRSNSYFFPGTVTQASQTTFKDDAGTNPPRVIHSLATTENKNTIHIKSTTTDNNLQKDNSVIFNVSDQSNLSCTKIVTEIYYKPKSAGSIHEGKKDYSKEERSTKVHKCVTCNELPNIFVHKNEDSVANQRNAKNTSTDLDFKKIKKDLCTGDDNLKLQLVQALRWVIIFR